MDLLFSGLAAQALAFAQEEARTLGQSRADREHILLGLIREGEGIAFRALQSFGITLEPARRLVAELTGQSQRVVTGPISFSPAADELLENAQRQAFRRGQRAIDTEHLLLSLISEEDGPVAYVLLQLGQPPRRVGMRVIHLLSASKTNTEPGLRHPLLRHRLGGEERRLVADVLECVDVLVAPLTALDQGLRVSPSGDDGQPQDAAWATKHPDLSPAAANSLHRLYTEIGLLRDLLRQQDASTG